MGAKHHVGGIAFLILLTSFAILGLSGWAVDRGIDDKDVGLTNDATALLLSSSLLSGLATAAAAIAGLLHSKHYRAGSLAAASALSLFAWLSSILSLGLAAKQIDLGKTDTKFTALAILDIVQGFFLTVYVLLLHGGLFDRAYGSGY